MKKKNKINLLFNLNIVIAIILIYCLPISKAIANNTNYNIPKNWFFGINTINSKTKYKSEFGDNIFYSKSQLDLNYFISYMFNNNFAIEIGLYRNSNMKHSKFLSDGVILGIPYVEYANEFDYSDTDPNAIKINNITFNSNIKQKHVYIGGKYKIDITENKSNINIMLGMSLSNLKAHNTITSVNNNSIYLAKSITNNFKSSKIIPIIKMNFEYKLNPSLIFQITGVWKQTSRFIVKSQEYPNDGQQLKLKNNLGTGIGIVYCI